MESGGSRREEERDERETRERERETRERGRERESIQVQHSCLV